MKRTGNKRKLKPYILIVCEGKTEERYFKSIKEDVEYSDYAIDIIVKETDKTTAVELVEIAQSEITKDDKDGQYWAVFDKNGYKKHEDAFKNAQKRRKKVHIAFSSISFEHWILLHYEKNRTPFPKSQNVIDYLDDRAYYPDYQKAKSVIYPKIKDKVKNAIENAAWLRHNMQNELKQNGGKIYEVNPYTDMDRLVSVLLNYNQKIIWGKIGEFASLEGLYIKIEKYEERQNDLLVEIVMRNNHKSYTHLENNNSQNFYLTDNKEQRFDFTIQKAVIIAKNETKNFELIFPKSAASNDTKLNFQFKNYILFVELTP